MSESLNPAALSIEQLARVLSAASGANVTQPMIEADLAAGAPTNADGTINVVHYAAWLAKQAALGSRESG